MPLDQPTAERFARLALDGVHREYPNKIAHTLESDADVRPPRELTPAFYGCYDWHSAVHSHWTLARIARTFPNTPLAEKSLAALKRATSLPKTSPPKCATWNPATPSSAPTAWPGC